MNSSQLRTIIKTKYPDIPDTSIYDEIEEDIWDNVFMQ